MGSQITETYAQRVMSAMTDDMNEDKQWTGSLVNLMTELSIPRGYYSKVRTLLIRSGAAVQVQRGGGKALSIWEIVHPDARFDNVPLTAIKLEEQRSLEGRVDDLERLVGGVSVPTAIADLTKEVREGNGSGILEAPNESE